MTVSQLRSGERCGVIVACKQTWATPQPLWWLAALPSKQYQALHKLHITIGGSENTLHMPILTEVYLFQFDYLRVFYNSQTRWYTGYTHVIYLWIVHPLFKYNVHMLCVMLPIFHIYDYVMQKAPLIDNKIMQKEKPALIVERLTSYWLSVIYQRDRWSLYAITYLPCDTKHCIKTSHHYRLNIKPNHNIIASCSKWGVAQVDGSLWYRDAMCRLSGVSDTTALG